MTDSENSQPQDDSDEDIYKDIPEFNFEDELAKLEGSKETYKQEASDLSEKVKVLTEENKELKKSNEILKKNLSTLLKTAQAEVQRKDSMIQDLRTQVESFTFRRNKMITKDKYTSTYDLELSTKVKCEPKIHKNVSDLKGLKSYENQTNSDSELKPNPDEEKQKESMNSKDENINCDNDSGYRKSSKTNFRHSESSHERYREKKSSRYKDSSEYRRSYRNNHRNHLKTDSFEKNQHSRSLDSRFLSRHRHSRERRSDHRRHVSSERRRSEESSERSRRRKGRSRSREISRESKESSLEKPKTRSSLDKDPIVRNKDPIHTKPEVSNGVRGSDVTDNKKTRIEISEKSAVEEEGGKNKHVKEKRLSKQEKRSGLDIFNTKSPLDALYNEMVTSRSFNRFSNSKPVTAHAESDFEEGELLSVTKTGNEVTDTSESQPEEDWTLSFKNERQNKTKPMTLYSRRMVQKFRSELETAKNQTKKEESEKPVEYQKTEKVEEVEKEPGELTDDENIVESSKEFQELTKVASIEIELNEKPENEKTFREPIREDSSKTESKQVEPTLEENQNDVEKSNYVREEPTVCKELEPNRETREVIEFSPFKNNYKLIEISPIKSSSTEHILDFYSQRTLPPLTSKRVHLDSSEAISDSEKSKQSDTSEEKNSEAELKIVIPPVNSSPKEKEMTSGNEVKESKKMKEKTDAKKSNENKKEDNLGKEKRKSVSKKEIEMSPFADEKSQKRKRKSSETDEGISDSKKRKLEKDEPSRKSSRSKLNSESEPETVKPETEPEQIKPEPEKKIKEDISSFEFFKPAAKPEVPQTPNDGNKSVPTTTDYKMTATMSVTGVVRLETPDKCMEKLKNLMINEHMIFNVLESKSNSQFSPLIGSKCIEMTPRRMLKNDLMLTDSEDDSVIKQNAEGEEEEEEEEGEEEDVEEEEEVEEEEVGEVGEEEDETSGSENSECDSDSGASDFVDLL